MKIAQTVRIVSGEEIEEAWVYEAPYWIGINRLPSSLQEAEGIRKLQVKERTSKLVDTSQEVSIWTLR